MKVTTAESLANKLKRSEIEEKKSLVKFRESEVREKDIKCKQDADKIIITKIETLRSLLCALTFDTDGISGMEQKLKPVFDESEQQTIKNKIFDIVTKL